MTDTKPVIDPEKQSIQRFWSSVYDEAYSKEDAALTGEKLLAQLAELEDMFRYQGHGAVVEMPLGNLAGKSVLEIGCGAGGHSALFASHGAHMTSVDITPARVRSVALKFSLMESRAAGCRAMQADAENLPFADDSFDIVYSNGVLHHTEDTEKAVAEAYRVLRPGGRAVIMLYCKSSFHYWFTLFFCVGILKGQIFRNRRWLGHATEWIGRGEQTELNPMTRCYSRRGLRQLFTAFERPGFRKMGFFFYAIPKLGRLYRRYQIRKYGEHPGGMLVYGAPWPRTSPLEIWLGRYIGFAWFITAFKRDQT